MAALATAVAVVLGGTRYHAVAATVLGLALAAVASRVTLFAALGSGLTGWLFFDGFFIGRHASLRWDGPREACWLLALVAAAGCGYALGRVRRGRRGR